MEGAPDFRAAEDGPPVPKGDGGEGHGGAVRVGRRAQDHLVAGDDLVVAQARALLAWGEQSPRAEERERGRAAKWALENKRPLFALGIFRL